MCGMPPQRIPLPMLELKIVKLQELVAGNPTNYEDVPDCTLYASAPKPSLFG